MGSWGTALGSVLAGSAPTTIWARRPAVADEINVRHTNGRYFENISLDRGLRATSFLQDAVSSADLVLLAVQSHSFRSVLEQAARHIRRFVPIVSLTKGLEGGTRLRMTEIVDELNPGHPAGVLAGPSVARDLLDGRAAAAVITRGLAELTRLGTALGGDPETFAGLAGMGDLIVTCFAPLSPGRRVGEALARGRPIGQIVGELGHVAEGIRGAGMLVDLAAAHGLSMPIAFEVHAVISGTRDGADAFHALRPRATAGKLERVA